MEERRTTLRWVLILGTAGTTAAGAFNLVVWFQAGIWQMAAMAGAAALALACLLFVAWLSRQQAGAGRAGASATRWAGPWLLVALLTIFVPANLLHGGITPYLALSGVVLLMVVGLLLLPDRWPVWLALVVAYGAFAWLVDRFPPLPRYELGRLGPQADAFTLAIVAFMLVGALWALIRTYRRAIAIRFRLLLSFVLVVLLTLAIVVAALVVVGSQNGRRQAIYQLDSIANIKQGEIEDWLAGVQSDLDAVVGDSEVMPRVLVVLENPQLSQAQEFFTWSYLRQVVAQAPRLEALALFDTGGNMVLSTDPQGQGQDAGASSAMGQAAWPPGGDAPAVEQGLRGFYLEAPTYVAAEGRVRIMAARPVVGNDGQASGVLVASLAPASLGDILGRRAWLGETGEVYLVDGEGHLLTDLRYAADAPPDPALAAPAVEALGSAPGAEISAEYDDYRGVPVVGIYRWLPDLGATLVAKQDLAEALSLTNSLLRVLAVASLAAFGMAVGGSLLVTQSIVRPLADLTEVTERIAGGDLSLRAPTPRRDEIGKLAFRFNTMTAQLRELIGTLEERVADRTRELERRSTYLEAAAEIGQATSSILDPEQLMQTAVELVRTRFDLTDVALFVVEAGADGPAPTAVLRAGSLRAGAALLERGHRLRVGQATEDTQAERARLGDTGLALASACIRQARARVSSAGSREAALPLRSRGQVLGALVVQDLRAPDGAVEPVAGPGEDLDQDQVATLQTMADQIAVALDNARLFVQSQQALEAERRAYGEVSRDAWRRLIRSRRLRGYRCDEQGVTPLPGGARPPAADASIRGHQMTIPVVVRDETIGVLSFSKPQSGANWSAEEVALGQSMTEELGQALESARLYADTQRRAAQERLIGEVTARIRETLDVDTVLQTAVQEMRQALGFAEVEVLLDPGAGPGSATPADLEDDGKDTVRR